MLKFADFTNFANFWAYPTDVGPKSNWHISDKRIPEYFSAIFEIGNNTITKRWWVEGNMAT